MIKHCFAFDHVNYARYLAYQQVYLRDLEKKDHPAINDLKTCSISGRNLSTLHGDLITEIFNGQTKHQAGPHRKGVSTNIKTTNRWIRTTHIYAKLRMELMKKIKASSVHKELTPGICLHLSHVKSLKDQLKWYGSYPFGEGPARNFSTGRGDIIVGLLDA